jgi:cold shock protein
LSKTGIVKIFMQDKGFGFIKQDDRGKDLYFHRTGLLDQTLDPYPTDRVRYTVSIGDRGPTATSITITEKGDGWSSEFEKSR